MRTLALAFCAFLLLASPAAAKEFRLVAAGEAGNVTTCTASVTGGVRFMSPMVSVSGRTECSVAIYQTAQIRGDDTGELCSAVTLRCSSSVSSYGGQRWTYNIQLIAPRGQGWVVAPESNCYGMGTDNLHCSFVKTDSILDVA